MSDTNLSSEYDPYRPLAQRLKRSDSINRLLLLRPRRSIVQLLKGQRVLDVCCGTGNLTAMLAAAGCQVVGVDSSPTMLSFAQRKHIAAEFQLVDASRLPFNREFDAAVISIALHEMPPQMRDLVWASMRRAVRPQGRLIALDFAVPQGTSIVAGIAHALIERDERSFATIHPEHYENFQEFMQNGGLRAWLRERDETIDEEHGFLGGTVIVAECRRSEPESG